jgi:predicted amino acid dehydrogenase
MGDARPHLRARAGGRMRCRPATTGRTRRFAFVAHVLSVDDFRRFDPTLKPFGDAQLETLRSRITHFMKPCPLDDLAVAAVDGGHAVGELIALPYLPEELVALPQEEAVELVQRAVDLGVERGAEVIGLAGFTSIVTYGGLAVKARDGVRVTSGNSYTTWSAMQAVEAACRRLSIALGNCAVAVVGATGVIGHALSLLCAERAAELILIGNPEVETSIDRLQLVAADCRRHLLARVAAGHKVPIGGVADRLVSRPASAAADPGMGVTVTTDIDRHLARAHVVLTATSAVQPFISARHLRNGALVCDVSRPFNVTSGLRDQRPDLHWVDGGLVRAPDRSVLGILEETGRSNVLVSCAAETIILTLSGFRSEHLCGRLDPATIEELGRVAAGLGFTAAA